MAALAELEEAWMTLLNRLKALATDSRQESFFQRQYAFLVFVSPNDAPVMTEDELSQRLRLLARYLNTGIDKRDWFILNQFTVLADASREAPLLRSHYGLRTRSTPTANAIQLDGLQDPDCILELSRRILDLELMNVPLALKEQALRIVANCCADNNINRSLIIGRHGIKTMTALADRREVLHVLLPCLYNVCVDYDELAAGLDETQLQLSEQMNEPSRKESSTALTLAEQELGMFNEKLDKSSLEIFLNLTHEIDASQLAVLADVVEMASRPALFGIEHVFGATDHFQRGRILLQTLAEFSRDYTADEDARASICQTYLNLLTQPVIQQWIVQFPNDLEALIELPYLDRDTTDEVDPFITAFLKLAYEISSLPTYPGIATPDSNLICNLTDRLETNHEQSSLVLVFLANSLNTLDRTSHFHRLHKLQSHLTKILLTHTNSTTLLPALSLCTRLALTPPAQQDLFAVNIFSAIAYLIQPATQSTRTTNGHQENRLEIHREALTLTRLIVKSQQNHAISLLTEHAALLSRIIDLAGTSIDAASKVEAGRLLIEILRTLLSRSNPPATTADETLQQLSSLTTPEAMNAILFLLTDAPSSALKAECLFGLSLLATLPELVCASDTIPKDNVKSTITSCLHAHQEKVMPIFKTLLTNPKHNNSQSHTNPPNTTLSATNPNQAPHTSEVADQSPYLEATTPSAPMTIPAQQTLDPQLNNDSSSINNGAGSANAEVENLKFLLSLLARPRVKTVNIDDRREGLLLLQHHNPQQQQQQEKEEKPGEKDEKEDFIESLRNLMLTDHSTAS